MYTNLTFSLILLPLIGFLISGLFGKKIGGKLSSWFSTAVIIASFFIAIVLFQKVQTEGAFQVNFFTWLSVSVLHIDMAVYIDHLSAWMMLIITGIGSLIHIYSIGYMHDDEGIARFFSYLNLFIFSMLMLVMGSNLITLFIGWEGVGLCSYLLIGFWYKNKEYGHAARKAFIMNRIGDLGLLIGIFLCIVNFGTVNFTEIHSAAASGVFKPELLTLITCCLFIGAMGKSAQIPLYTWLPDAMAGPTPVSALIHAATMVTAGVYLVVRNATLFEMAPYTKDMILYVGLATSLLGAIIGLFQDDIKKVLAYSTVSQLGLMFVAIGIGAYTSAMFHLTTHAFFKALLFLGAGSVIHAMSGEQNILKMGGLWSKIRATHTTFLIGTLAIIGFPLMSGFFSKDEILEKLFNHSPMLWGLTLISAALTIIYMIRLYILTFWGSFRGTEDQRKHLHESPVTMTFPLTVLAVLSLFGGFINLPPILAGEKGQQLAHWFHNIFSLKDLPEHHSHLTHSTEYMLMGIAISLVFILGFIAYKVFIKPKASEGIPRVGFAALGEQKFKVDEFYQWLIVRPLESLSHLCYHYIEKFAIQPIFFGSGRLFYMFGQYFRMLQNGNVEYYLLYIGLGAIGLIAALSYIIK